MSFSILNRSEFIPYSFKEFVSLNIKQYSSAGLVFKYTLFSLVDNSRAQSFLSDTSFLLGKTWPSSNHRELGTWSHSLEENFLWPDKTSCTGRSAQTWMQRGFQRKLSHITPCCTHWWRLSKFCTKKRELQCASVESKGGFYFTKQLEVGWPKRCFWRTDTNLSTCVEYHWILWCMPITTRKEVRVPETLSSNNRPPDKVHTIYEFR